MAEASSIKTHPMACLHWHIDISYINIHGTF